MHDYYLSKLELKNFDEWDKERENLLKKEKDREKWRKKPYKSKYNEWLEKVFEVPLGRLKIEIRNKNKKSVDDMKDFYPSIDDFCCFPKYSFLIKFLFALKKPYTSKGDEEFYLLEETSKNSMENPIVRDRFTGLPIVRPSTWKGHLRFAAKNVKWSDEAEKKIIIERLFGSEPEKKQEMLKGRLHFFTTFFVDEAEKDIITPLRRDTRTPTNRGPIPLEVIKPEKDGYFYLLYFPYPKKGESEIDKEVKKDLIFLGEALKLMFYTYGFSAKKTSGFGVIKEKIKSGEILLKIDGGCKAKKIDNLNELNSKIIFLLEEPGGAK